MALTQRTGALAYAGGNAQAAAANVANLAAAAALQYRPPSQPAQFRPAPAPVAQARNTALSGAYSGGSAAAAQQILNRAVQSNRQQPNALQNAAKQAVLTALAVAGAGQPGRAVPQSLQPFNRQSNQGVADRFSPERQSQQFDQQIQITKAQADPRAWLDPAYPARMEQMGRQLATMQNDPMRPIQSPRIQQEQQALAQFPQMTAQELRGRSGEQLAALLGLAQQPPASAAGAPDQSTPSILPQGQMSKGSDATWEFHDIGGPSMQYGNQQVGYGPMGWSNGLPNRTGAQQVTDAMNGVIEQTSANTTGGDQGGGGFLDTLGGLAGDAVGLVTSPLGPLGTLIEGGQAAWQHLSPTDAGNVVRELADSAAGTYEQFMSSAPGKVLASGLGLLDKGRVQNTKFVGGMFTQWANGEDVGYLPGGALNPLNTGPAIPILIIGIAWERVDPDIKEKIKTVAQEGYSSPGYIKVAESQGLNLDEIGPQFTGDQAVWEFLMGASTDELPTYLKYPLRMVIDTVYDPLTYLGGVAAMGARGRAIGAALRGAEDASLGARVAGGVLKGTGALVEGAARAPDLPVELLVKGGGKLGGRIGEVTGLLSPTTAGQRAAAGDAARALDEALPSARESIVPGEMRTAFDAEAQGVTPTSGPVRIETPPVAEAAPPASEAAPSPRETGTSSPSRAADESPVVRTTTADDPRFRDYATADEAESAALSLYDDWRTTYGHTLPDDALAREGAGIAGARLDSGMFPDSFKPRRMNVTKAMADKMPSGPDGYTIIKNADGTWRPTMSAETKAAKAGGTPTVRAATATATVERTGTPPRSERVSPRSLSESRDLENYLRENGADEETIQGAVQDFLSTRFGDERDAAAATGRSAPPPITQVERDAAAAANAAPSAPRNSFEAEVAKAAESARATPKGRKSPMTAAEKRAHPQLGKAIDRGTRLAKEDAEGLPKEVNRILAAQKPGEHEFSPIFGGHRPLDQIVTKAIDSKDPTLLKKADAFVKEVDAAVEQHLRPDAFHKTWKNGGAPVHLQADPRLTDEFFAAMTALDPEADLFRQRVLANGLAKGVLDDIAELQFQVNHLFPMLMESYPDEFVLDGLLGAVGRHASKDFRAESAEWLLREYLDTPDPAQADLILHTFLTGETELPVLTDGIHKPYAHAIPSDYHAESIARLQQMREQWRTIKRSKTSGNGSVVDVPDTPFRDPDRAAQFAGGSRVASKSFAESLRSAHAATRHTLISDEAVLAAIGEIRDGELRDILLKGNGKFTVDQARLADRSMPEGWKPPGYTGDKTSWNTKDALDAIREQSLVTPAFDHAAARDEIGQLAAGLQPKRTAAELRSMRKAAHASGIDPKTVVDGTTNLERVTATKGIRALDWKLRQYRALRLFNPIIGLPNRIGDVLGNMTSHLIAGDVGSAIKQAPLTFTEAKAFRDVARDQGALLKTWAHDTNHMAETGMLYPDSVFGYTKLSDAGLNTGLPPVNAKVANSPRAVRTAASLWSSPALKDMTTSGEMVGRKLAFDRVYVETIQREAWPAFKEELEKRFPGRSQELLDGISKESSGKGGKSWNGYFSAGDVLAATGDTQLQRMWQRELNRASDKGAAEADRLFFTGRMTNADEIARRTLTFHYWMVRASVLYGRTVLRNPVLLSGFYRVHERAAEMAREQGLPGWLSTMLKFYTIPGKATGYAAMDPIGALFPTIFLDAYSQEGNKFQALQNLLVPEWSAALGALGLTQNTPDLTGTRTIERFIVDMGNFLKGEGVPLESIPGFGKFINQDSLQLTIPTEEFTKWALGKANDYLGVFGTFAPFDRQANEEDQLFSVGESVGVTLWGDDITAWTPAQVQELQDAVHQAQYGDGEETWLSETIRAQYGREGGARAGFSLLIPGGVVTRQAFRDEQIELAGNYWQDFYAGQPTTKAGESAAVGRQLATSANPVWVAMNSEYYKIGTKDEQAKYTLYNNLLFSPDELNPKSTIVVDQGDGTYTFYTMAELAAMSDDDRSTVVNAWAANTEGMAPAVEKVRSGRDQFKVDHPDYGQYTEYQKGVYDYPGGISQFRKDMTDNPTFKAAEDAKRAQLKKEGKSGSVLEAELDDWATKQEAFTAAMGEAWKHDSVVGGTPGPQSVQAMQNLKPEPKDDSGGSSGGTSDGTTYDPTVDDYWAPPKGVARLNEDQTQYDYDNAEMERRFGPYWNEATGDWENNADSAKERDYLGIGDKTYVYPSVSDTMRRYEAWEEEHPGGTPEEFFELMLKTEGFGKKVGTTTTAMPAGGVTYKPTTLRNPKTGLTMPVR